jgi:hypothetical protein
VEVDGQSLKKLIWTSLTLSRPFGTKSWNDKTGVSGAYPPIRSPQSLEVDRQTVLSHHLFGPNRSVLIAGGR